MSEVSEAFGGRVRAARKARGWSQRELGRRADMQSQNTVHRVELGAEVVLSAAAGLANALGIPLGNLTAPVKCRACFEVPPAGFSCQECGALGAPVEVSP